MQRTALQPIALVALHVKGSGWRTVGLTPMPVSPAACTQATSQSQPKADSRLNALASARSGAASKALPLRQTLKGAVSLAAAMSSHSRRGRTIATMVRSERCCVHENRSPASERCCVYENRSLKGARRRSALAATPPERPTN